MDWEKPHNGAMSPDMEEVEPFHLALVRLAVAHQNEMARLRAEISFLRSNVDDSLSPTPLGAGYGCNGAVVPPAMASPSLAEFPPPPQVPPPLMPRSIAAVGDEGSQQCLPLALPDKAPPPLPSKQVLGMPSQQQEASPLAPPKHIPRMPAKQHQEEEKEEPSAAPAPAAPLKHVFGVPTRQQEEEALLLEQRRLSYSSAFSDVRRDEGFQIQKAEGQTSHLPNQAAEYPLPSDSSTTPDPQADGASERSNLSNDDRDDGKSTHTKSQRKTEYSSRSQWAGNFTPGRRSMGEDRVSSRATIVAKLNKLPNTITSDGEDKDQEVKIVRFVWIPNCPTRLAWDLSGAFLLLHDMIFFPLSAVEPLDGFTYFIAADIFMMLFWTLDMAGSFITAYYSKGQLILDHRRIAMHYIKTWFLLDIAIVFPDWLQMLVNTGDGGDSFKVLKILRIARIARLTRLMKLKRLMATAGDMVNSEYVSVIFTVIKLFIFMLFVTHFIGCTWYMVGTSTVNSGNPQNWIQIHDFLEEPFLYRYFTTLHWSITQFTPGSMHVQPQNLRERIFAVIVLLFGMIIFSSFVSSMTSAMTALRAIHAGVSKQLWLLRRYLRENNVDRALSFRILRYVEHQTASQEDNLQESRVDLLKSLSDQLRLELKVATTMQPLRVHPILAQFHDGAPITVQQVVRQAVSVKNLAMSDTMFNNKQIASQMYVAASGQLSYTLRKKRTFPVKKGIWVSEAVLWTAWQHAGDLQAATDCRVLCIDQDAFGKVIVNSPPAKDLASQHAREFIEWLNNCGVEEHTDAPCDEEYRTMMLNFAKTQNQRNSLSWQVDQIQAVSV